VWSTFLAVVEPTLTGSGGQRRSRGSIRSHYGGFQARVSAGFDPSTGERIILHETVATRREAEKALTRLLGEADALKTARTKASFGVLLDRWLAGHEVEVTTRATYHSLIRNHIHPGLGAVSLAKLHRGAAEILEGFYAELRRCSRRCDRRPFLEHRSEGEWRPWTWCTADRLIGVSS
jgi:integrase